MSNRGRYIKLKMKSAQSFLTALFLTFIVWIVSEMSTERQYPATFSFKVVGYDTAQFAISYNDSVVNLNLISNGFRAFQRSLSRKNPVLEFNLNDVRLQNGTLTKIKSLNIQEFEDQLIPQLPFSGIKGIDANGDSIHFQLSERMRKAYVPNIHDVDFSFENQVALAGQPIIEPDTIYLYGSEYALTRISQIKAIPTTIANIKKTESYLIEIDTTWKSLGDVYSSTNQIRITIPVGTYTEKKVKVPVKFQGLDSTHHVKLYPEEVELTVWVLPQDYQSITPSRFEATISRENKDVAITEFPKRVRIKNIKPSTVQYVIFK